MKIDALHRVLVFILLLLTQAIVLNSVHLFGVATPLLYVYFVIMFPRNYPRWGILLWSFFMGLCNDMFANTPGQAAAALTLTGFVQPWLLELVMPRDAEHNMKTAASTLGTGKFATLALMLTTIHCLTFFALESFQFINMGYWLLSTIGSILLTWTIIIALENIRK